MKGSGPPASPSKAVVFWMIDCSRTSLTSRFNVATNSGAETSLGFSTGDSATSLPLLPSSSGGAAALSLWSPKRRAVPREPATTVILFCVNVPVLSEQMVVAFPMVSQDRRRRTRLLSFNMRVVANANARVTASGRPSGTATTMTVMATMRMLRKF